MIKQLLNSVIAKYRDLSVSRRSIICLSLQTRAIRQITIFCSTSSNNNIVNYHVLTDKDMRTTIILFTSSSDIQSSGRGLGGVVGGSITVFSSSPCFFFFFFLFLAFRHCCGKDDAFAGPKRRENLSTWPGRNSGNRSVTVLPS